MKHFFAFCLLIALFLVESSSIAQKPEQVFPALGTPVSPKVPIAFNRYYDSEALVQLMQKIVSAYPRLARMESIGKSFENRDIYCLVITNKDIGTENQKPGYYVDGNIHSNEIQAAEVSLYIAWYLTESHANNKFIQQLLNEKVFYIIPTINPDGRNNFLHRPNTTHSPRSGMMPRDDDRDGRIDEDPFNDLDQDGHITMIRRKNPKGKYRPDTKDPRRMVLVEQDEIGSYEMLGWEGLDDDGDGKINEDGIGYYDPNRDWAWGWQPEYIQWGAGFMPFMQPENYAVAQFILSHPNIAGAMTYHNTGGMLLRGPGNELDEAAYTSADIAIYDKLGKVGEKMLPGYRYITTYKDLYATYGGESDWLHGARGIIAFTGELYTPYLMFHGKDDGSWWGKEEDLYLFDKHLTMGDAFVEWKTYDHPQFGLVEIGGFKKNYARINPGFLLEEDCHRNCAFVLYHAYHTPQLEFSSVTNKPLTKGLFEVTATVYNSRITPTHIAHDIKHGIEVPDFISLESDVIAGMVVYDKNLNLAKEADNRATKVIPIANINGESEVTVRWLTKVNPAGSTITLKSQKGGTITTKVPNAQ